jgi:hypothetical protein
LSDLAWLQYVERWRRRAIPGVTSRRLIDRIGCSEHYYLARRRWAEGADAETVEGHLRGAWCDTES